MPGQVEVRNAILRRLRPDDLSSLLAKAEAVDLPRNMILEEPGKGIEFTYFLEDGLCSVVVGRDEMRAEAAHIGYEGATGSALLHGVSVPNAQSVMQIKGHGWQLAAADLLQLVDAIPDLKRMCLLFSQALTTQIANALLAAAKFRIQQRLARWLLMCHDRTKGDTLSLTHEFLALMLAVRRSGVTTELHILEGKGLIRATRGRITMIDREGLIEIAAGCYGVPEREYERLFPPLRRH